MQMKKRSRSLFFSAMLQVGSLFTCLAIVTATAHASVTSEQAAIVHLISKTYDRPDAKVQIAPIVVEADYAIADWTQGDKGGRALLQKSQSQWEILLCGGAGLKTVSGLVSTGIPSKQAKALAQKLKIAEKSLSASHLKQLDSFGQIVHMKQAHPNSTHGPAKNAAHGEHKAHHD